MRKLIQLSTFMTFSIVSFVSFASIPGTEVVENDDFGVIVPSNWRTEKPFGSVKLFLDGDGKGFPLKDKNGPLQVGFTVDKYRHDPMTLEQFIEESLENIKKDKRLSLLKTKNETEVELSDGTVASLFIVVMEKHPQRQSLQMKLIIKNHEGADWIVTAWLVGSRNSKIAKIGSPEMKKLLAHMKTFVFDQTKLNESSLKKHYK